MFRNGKIRWALVLMLLLPLAAACGAQPTGTPAGTTAAPVATTAPAATTAPGGTAGMAETAAPGGTAGMAETAAPGGTAGMAETAAPGGTAGMAETAAPGAATGAPVNIAVIPKSTTVAYWQRVGEGVQEATQQNPNIKATYEAPSDEGAVEEQIRFIEAAITKKPDALVVAPSGGAETAPTLQRAVDAGIPVVLLDTDIPDFTAKAAFVGTDNRAGGELAGKYIAEQLKNTGNVAILRGRAGDPVGNARTEGAQTAMEAAGLKIVAVQPADWVREKGQSVAENLLTANPDLKAIVCNNDEMALGAVQAAQAAGRNDLIIVGFDASPDALQSIADGKLTATVAQFPQKMGRLGVETAAKVARGEKVEAFVDTGVELVTKDNVSQFQK